MTGTAVAGGVHADYRLAPLLDGMRSHGLDDGNASVVQGVGFVGQQFRPEQGGIVPAYPADGCGKAARIGERFPQGLLSPAERAFGSRCGREVGRNGLCGGNLVFRRFGQRNAYRVAHAVGQQRPDADGRFDASFQSAARFRHPEVEGIVHPFEVHCGHEHPVGVYHDAGVARLHGDDHPVETLPPAYAQVLHGRLHHAFRRIAVESYHLGRERTVVHADAQGGTASAALLQQRLEAAAAVVVVAGIYPHFVRERCYGVGHLGNEVHVGHQCGIGPPAAYLGCNDTHALRFPEPLRGKPHDTASGLPDASGLRDAGFGIVRIAVGHRLYGHRMAGADGDAAYLYLPAPAPVSCCRFRPGPPKPLFLFVVHFSR